MHYKHKWGTTSATTTTTTGLCAVWNLTNPLHLYHTWQHILFQPGWQHWLLFTHSYLHLLFSLSLSHSFFLSFSVAACAAAACSRMCVCVCVYVHMYKYVCALPTHSYERRGVYTDTDRSYCVQHLPSLLVVRRSLVVVVVVSSESNVR